MKTKTKKPRLPKAIIDEVDGFVAACETEAFGSEEAAVTAIVHRFKQKDPAALGDHLKRIADEVKSSAAGYKLALGLDLGTSCGYCLSWFKPGAGSNPRAAYSIMGQLDLSTGSYDANAIRIVRLRQFLTAIMPQTVFFEDARYTPSETPNRFNANAIIARAATAMEWFGALKGCVGGWAEEHGVPCQGYPIGTIKKRATGLGNAGKPAVIKGANELFGVDLNPEGFESSGDDNIADAAVCLLLGVEQYAIGMN